MRILQCGVLYVKLRVNTYNIRDAYQLLSAEHECEVLDDLCRECYEIEKQDIADC